MRISRAQPDLRSAPGEIGFLGAQNVSNRIADLDEAPDDARVLGWNAIRAFAVADRNGDGDAVDNLGELVLDDEVAALLDRRTFGRGSDADGLVGERLALEPRRGWSRIDVGGKRVERGEQVLKQGIRFGADRQTGVGRAIGARGPRVRSEDHVWMLDEVAIDRERLFPVLRRQNFGEVDPVGGLRRLIRAALLEEQDVDDDVGSGRRAHGAFGQADRADEIGDGGEKHAGRRIDLVEGPAARDEGRESARPQPLDRPRNEIIVERQAEPAGGIVGADGAAAERRVADDEIVSLGDARLGEVLGADARVRIEEFCNPSCDRVHFDTGQSRMCLEGFRHEGEEEAGPASGLEHATAGEAHAAERPPDSPHHEFRGEMRVLRHAREARELGRRDQLLEVFPEGFPALREGFLGGSAEEVVGEFARAERREEGETLLFFRSRVPRPLLDLKHQSDGGDVVRRARLPVGAEAASARETEVARMNNDRRESVFLSLGDQFVDRLAEGEAGIEAHRGGEGGRVEERQAQLVGGGLHCDGNLSGARDRPAGAQGAAGIRLMGIEGRGGRAEARRSVRRLRPQWELSTAAHRPPCRNRPRRRRAPDGGRGSIRRSDWRRPPREKSRVCRP